MSTAAKKAKSRQIREWHLHSAQWTGPVRPRRGDQSSGAGLDQLLRTLLPLRVVLPCTAHQ
jgi:hypothetical protein